VAYIVNRSSLGVSTLFIIFEIVILALMDNHLNEVTAGQSREALFQQEQLLDAVAFSAKELLSSTNWTSGINEILRRLGEASGSSRVYVFQHDHDTKGNLITNLVFEWCSKGIQQQINNPELKDMEIAAAGFQRWIDLMSAGNSVYGAVDSFPEDERQLLESQSIKSFAVIPFFVSGKWWGFIGFDQCDRIRDWSRAELGALQAAASMIGSAIERQTSEEQLQKQFQELQKTNKELDFFVYSVSHDLRAPLASLLGLINLSGMEPLNSILQDYLSHMRNSVQRLDNFVKGILDYSRNSRVAPEAEIIDLQKFVKEISEQIIPMEYNISFAIDFHSLPGTSFRSDKKRLEVVLNNMLSNAVNFRDSNKLLCQIAVTIRVTELGASIQIQDNGIGIEAAHLDKIFGMFYRATEQGTGSGLGLYIVKEVIGILGGTVEVESVHNQYTRFNFWFPSLEAE
jgi:signal transduction histidine kinase